MKKIILVSLLLNCLFGIGQNTQIIGDNEILEYETYKDSLLTNTIKDISIKDTLESFKYYISYYKNGNINTLYLWVNGVEFGNWKRFYENGNKEEEFSFPCQLSCLKNSTKQVLDTNFMFYAETGQFLDFSVREYRNPRIGKYFRYYENGKIEIAGNYKIFICDEKDSQETKVGKWTYYNQKGNILLERFYDSNGQFIKENFKK